MKIIIQKRTNQEGRRKGMEQRKKKRGTDLSWVCHKKIDGKNIPAGKDNQKSKKKHIRKKKEGMRRG